MSWFAALCLLLLQPGALGFDIRSGDSLNHQEITQTAILRAAASTCHALAVAEDEDFTFPILTAEAVAAACKASKSVKSFEETIELIQKKNKGVDFWHFFDSEYHFDDEDFERGQLVISLGSVVVKLTTKLQNYEPAREELGKILHPLQDFYSHTNWVEMGNTMPNSNLIKVGGTLENIVAKDRATCRNCAADSCRDNILEDINREKILISGFFAMFSSEKPPGKCSHGGRFDATSDEEPRGGINKDTLEASHGHLHMTAANMAIAATAELLNDIRRAAGGQKFLQMLGLSRSRSPKPLSFVIDTTGSMVDDIRAVRAEAFAIIDSRVGTDREPSAYILVPFNDPDFGPLIRTTDPNEFKAAINSLKADGGGDFPEMSLSAVRLALTGSPSKSEIFVFTDATPKDKDLESTVIALAERTKSMVNFMITGSLGRRRRRSSGPEDEQHVAIRSPEAQVYRNVARASGGLAIEVSKSELPTATSIIAQSSDSSLVTILQASSPGDARTFTFAVDESLTNLTVYITGRGVAVTLISPSGVSQESSTSSGPLIIASQSVGNLQTLQLRQEPGLWEVRMMSTSAYILKVVGPSPIDFLFYFLEFLPPPFAYFSVIDNRPRAGVNGSLKVTVTGSESATLTQVSLVKSSGSGQVDGRLEAQGGGQFRAHFDTIPEEEFVVLVKGRDSSKTSSTTFQRQAATSIKASAVTISTAASGSVLVPGTPLSVPFTVTTSGAGGTFTIRASNDKGYNSTFPSTLVLGAGGSANGTVNLTAPATAASGSDVTLTIEAEDPADADSNYVVLRLMVLDTVTDFSPPVCRLLSLSSCSGGCSSMWTMSAVVTDGATGTGVDQVHLGQGTGTLTTSLTSENLTLASYRASCCAPEVELLAVDQVGNVASCSYRVDTSSPGATSPSPSSSSRAALSLLLCFCITILTMLTFPS